MDELAEVRRRCRRTLRRREAGEHDWSPVYCAGALAGEYGLGVLERIKFDAEMLRYARELERRHAEQLVAQPSSF